MKFWRSFCTVLGVVLFSSFLVFTQVAQALDFNSFVQNSPRLLAVENERRNVTDDFFASEFAQKIDLNNSSIRDFRELRGFYPTLAGLIVRNAPYENVEDVLSIPDLTDAQADKLNANLDKFTVYPPIDVFNDGDERFNPGLY